MQGQWARDVLKLRDETGAGIRAGAVDVAQRAAAVGDGAVDRGRPSEAIGPFKCHAHRHRAAAAVTARSFVEKGLRGNPLKAAIRQAQVQAIATALRTSARMS